MTDANGVYDFTLTVGTVPGAFTLNAWAKNAAGQLITSDLNDTSPDRTLTITSPGNWTVSQLLPELAALKSDAQASQVLAAMTNDPASIAQALSQLSGPGSKLGGLAYSVVNGASGGPAVFVYQDTSPPDVAATTGRVTVDDSALVLSPGLSVGTKLVAEPDGSDVVISACSAVPTYAQWTHGEAVPGWKLTANTASVSTYNFQYYGWAYPSTAVGACF